MTSYLRAEHTEYTRSLSLDRLIKPLLDSPRPIDTSHLTDIRKHLYPAINKRNKQTQTIKMDSLSLKQWLVTTKRAKVIVGTRASSTEYRAASAGISSQHGSECWRRVSRWDDSITTKPIVHRGGHYINHLAHNRTARHLNKFITY